MSPSNEVSGTCSHCGRSVIFHDGNVTIVGVPHRCPTNSIATGNPYEPSEPDKVVRPTFKNSVFFDKHRKNNKLRGKH